MNRKKKMQLNKIKRALLEYFSGKKIREVARIVGAQPSTVSFWTNRGKDLGLTALSVKTMDELELEAQFFNKPGPKPDKYRPIDWELVAKVLRKSTVEEAWLLYRNSPGDSELPPLTLSGFTKRVKKWRKALEKARRVMAQQWEPGAYVLIDYAGDSVTIIDGNGEKIKVRFFLGVFPFSGLVFWYATPDATTQSWMTAIVEMFKYVGKVPDYIKHDNDTSLMQRAEWGNSECRKQFNALCRKYHMTNSPCRVYHPRDKALAESEVGHLTDIFIHTLDPEDYKSVEEINVLLREEMENYNAAVMKKRGISRKDLFANELPHLHEIADGHYEVGNPCEKRKVGENGCVTFETHDYMMPSEHFRETVLVSVGDDGMLQFKTKSGKLICTYPYFKAKVPDDNEGFLHIKPEFREEWEVTPQARLERAQESFISLSDNAAEWLGKFVAKNRREEKGTLAARIRWIEKKIEKAQRQVIEKSIRHMLEMGSTDAESLIACVKFYADEDKRLEELGGSAGGLNGACLRSLEDLLGIKKGRTIQ